MLLAHDPASRKYVLDRLDGDHIAWLAHGAQAALLAGKSIEIAYMPGDATWYSLVIAQVDDIIGAPGGGHLTDDHLTQSYLGGIGTYVIVYAQRNQAHFYSPGDDIEWLASKFDVTEASQLAIAELLKAVLP
jgi:hypothetical protein